MTLLLGTQDPKHLFLSDNGSVEGSRVERKMREQTCGKDSLNNHAYITAGN